MRNLRFLGVGILGLLLVGALLAGHARAAGELNIACDPSCTVAAGQSISFTATDTLNNNQPTYSGKTNWDFNGDHNYDQGTGNPIKQVFSNPGDYVVEASYGGETGTVKVSVTSASPPPSPPNVDFTCSPACAGDAGATISFPSSTNASKPVYDWDLNGDGTYGDSSVSSPSYTYNAPGSYNVTLKVTDSSTGQSNSASHPVTIYSPPSVTTGSAQPTSTTATLGGTVDPHGAPVTDCHFDYGSTAAYGSSVPCAQSPGDGSGPVPVSAAISGLTAGTMYHFRLVASHGFGNVDGADATFTTVGNAVGFTATLEAAGALQTGDATQLRAQASTPPGYQVYEYRWSFNNDGRWNTDTGSYNVASHHYARAGTHTAAVEVLATDGGGHVQETAAHVSFNTLSAAAGCSTDQTIGFLEFVASCITEDSGKYQMSLDGGVNLDGIELTSPSSGNKLTLDTTGASNDGDNPHHMWALRADGPIAISIADSPIGSIQLTTFDLNRTPLLLPIGADVPDQHAPGMRIFSFQAGAHCTPQPSAFPPVVCAQLPGSLHLEGTISLFVTGHAHDPAPGLALQANVHVTPPIDVTAQLGLTGNVTDGIHLDSFGFATPTFTIGSILTVDPVTFSYTRLDTEEGHEGDRDVYKGGAGIHFTIAHNAAGLAVAIRIANGGFQEANVNLTGTIPIGPVVLNQLGGTIGIDPTRVGANIGGIIGPLKISAGVLYTGPYNGQPMHIQVGSSDPEHDPNHVAALLVEYPSVNPVLKIGGTANIYGDGFLSGGITVDFALPNVDDHSPTVAVGGYVRGWFAPPSPGVPQSSYQISGGVHAEVNALIHIHGEVQGFVNNYYYEGANHSIAAGCGEITADFGPFHPSLGGWVRVDLAHGNHVDDGLDGSNSCNDISGYCAPAEVTGSHTVPPCLGFEAADVAAARVTSAPQRFWIPVGMSAENLRINSLNGLPRVSIRGPSGTYTSPSGAQSAAAWPRFVSGGDPAEHQLALVILHPKPGVYTVTPVPGSPAIAPVLEAHPLPDPRIRVGVSRRGSHWQLRYSLIPSRGQTVQFLERANDVSEPIGKPTGSAHGTIAFTPQIAHSTRRTIVAVVLEQGLAQAPRTVGAFRAPRPSSLRAPAKLKVSRSQNQAIVTWSAVPGANAYLVSVSGSDGRRVMYRVTRRRVVVPEVFPEVSLKLSVSGTGGLDGAPGPARSGRLAAAPRSR